MTADNPYQNQDIGTRNPFTPVSPEPSNEPQVATTNNTPKFKIPNDPKIKLLIILVILIVALSLISLIVTAVRKSQLKPPVRQVTPTATVTIAPTETPAITIPLDINSKFDQIDKNTQINIQFTPPQIDPDIGL